MEEAEGESVEEAEGESEGEGVAEPIPLEGAVEVLWDGAEASWKGCREPVRMAG